MEMEKREMIEDGTKSRRHLFTSEIQLSKQWMHKRGIENKFYVYHMSWTKKDFITNQNHDLTYPYRTNFLISVNILHPFLLVNQAGVSLY